MIARVTPCQAAALAALALACAAPSNHVPPAASASERDALNATAETYVKLVLALGVRDPDEVDAYYGPQEWRKEAEVARAALVDVERRAEAALAALGPDPAGEAVEALRRRSLSAGLRAVRTRAAVVAGSRLTFDEEAMGIYGVVPPQPSEAELQRSIDAIDRALPGGGPVAARLEAFRARFEVPADRLRGAIEIAIAECRARTLRHLALPAGESFSLEMVSGKPWSGYNWYQGGYRSVIQINTDVPTPVDRILDIGCHEGYPGHHVYYSLQDDQLARARGWTEYLVNPLFSPGSLVAEGSATYGVDVAFPGAEKLEFERRAIWPTAGLDPAEAERYDSVQKLSKGLRYARNEAARRLVEGKIDAAGAVAWLERHALMSPARAAKTVAFTQRYRTYVMNYNYGEDLVRAWVERTGGATAGGRWRAFEALLVTPRTPADLQ